MIFTPEHIIFGALRQEYILPHAAPPQIDVHGGDLLYAACGAALWHPSIGLAGLVGEDYPRRRLIELEKRGFDTRGIHINPGKMDLRWYIAYDAQGNPLPQPPMTAFAERHLPYPKTLLGYRNKKAPSALQYLGLTQYLPEDYLHARAAHIGPFPTSVQNHFVGYIKQGDIQTLSLLFNGEEAHIRHLDTIHSLIKSVTAFIITEKHLRQIFFERMDRSLDMLEALNIAGGEFIIVLQKRRGALLLDIPSQKRWQVPAYPSRTVDPTGYTDAFCGGFLSGFRATYRSLDGVLHGMVAASLANEGSGPMYLLDTLPALARSRLDFLRHQVQSL